MTRDDWTGLGTSLALHALALVLLAFAVAAEEPPEPLGLIAVEFGPFEMARPAARAETPRPAPTAPQPATEPQQPAPKPQPREAEPVNLPKPPPAPSPERQPPPEREAVAQPESRPEQATEPAPERAEGGSPQGQAGTTAEAGDTGTGTSRRAPYSIEGLNRTPLRLPLPGNPGAAGTAVLNVCVAPDGQVSRLWPARRSGDPRLDDAAQRALNGWRFNALPPAAPQEEQCGLITFHFTLS